MISRVRNNTILPDEEIDVMQEYLKLIRENKTGLTATFKQLDVILRQKVNWSKQLVDRNVYIKMCIASKAYDAELQEFYQHKPKCKAII